MEYHKEIPIKEIKTIFLDYDGTLHDSLKIYARAFKKAYDYLVKEGLSENRNWSDKELSYWLGFNANDMWKSFQPELSPALQQHCSSIISREMKVLIEQGKPVLYEDSLETLSYLKKKGYHLIFISNCNYYYMESHRKLFHLDKYFEKFICSEEYSFLPKHEIIKLVKNLFPEKMVIVGDRKQDMDAGKNSGIFTIGCKYGYALDKELDESDILINRISDLIDFL